MINLPPIPKNIALLPRDERGYPVPWFVAWIDGKPEFRVADGRKWVQAVKLKMCWVCGQKLDYKFVFPIGPMCAVNQTTAEPPCHAECAHFSVKACPFLSMPKAVRRESNLPENTATPGEAIMRNPGVTCLWFCRGYDLFDDGRGGKLIHIANASHVEWWSQGRRATKDEVIESIETGLPRFMAMAEEQSVAEGNTQSIGALQAAVSKVLRIVPRK